jgi:hypothetical protein
MFPCLPPPCLCLSLLRDTHEASDMTTIAESVSSPAPAAAISNKRPLDTKPDAANTDGQKTKQRSVLGGLQGKQVRTGLRPAA